MILSEYILDPDCVVVGSGFALKHSNLYVKELLYLCELILHLWFISLACLLRLLGCAAYIINSQLGGGYICSHFNSIGKKQIKATSIANLPSQLCACGSNQLVTGVCERIHESIPALHLPIWNYSSPYCTAQNCKSDAKKKAINMWAKENRRRQSIKTVKLKLSSNPTFYAVHDKLLNIFYMQVGVSTTRVTTISDLKSALTSRRQKTRNYVVKMGIVKKNRTCKEYPNPNAHVNYKIIMAKFEQFKKKHKNI